MRSSKSSCGEESGAAAQGRGDERGGRARGDRGAEATDSDRYYADGSRLEYRGRGEYLTRPHPHPHSDPQPSRDWYYNVSPVRSQLHHASGGRGGGGGGGAAGGGDLYGGREAATSSHGHSSTLESLLRGGPSHGGARAVGVSRGIPSDSKRGVPVAPPSGAERPKPTRGRATLYLTEADRQDIMDRIRRGEKQADLAKEYSVSRAAITNLKQRRQMLEMLENSANIKDREEAQKRRRLSHVTPADTVGAGGPGGAGLGGAGMKTQQDVVGGGNLVDEAVVSLPSPVVGRRTRRYSSDAESDGTVSNEASSLPPREEGLVPAPWASPEAPLRPACHREVSQYTTSRLLASLLDPQTSDDEFRGAVARHTRLLLEETIGWSYSQMPDRYEPYALSFGSEEAAVFLDEYCRMEPATPSTELHDVQQRTHGEDLELVVRVPMGGRVKSPVLVFLDDIVPQPETEGGSSSSSAAGGAGPSTSATGSPSATEARTTSTGREATRQCLFLLNSLVFCGIPEYKIVLVVSMCVESVASEIAQRFPDVHVVTTRFLSDRASAQERAMLVAYRQRRRALMQLPRATAHL